jgi:hypothetical protein
MDDWREEDDDVVDIRGAAMASLRMYMRGQARKEKDKEPVPGYTQAHRRMRALVKRVLPVVDPDRVTYVLQNWDGRWMYEVDTEIWVSIPRDSEWGTLERVLTLHAQCPKCKQWNIPKWPIYDLKDLGMVLADNAHLTSLYLCQPCASRV